MQDHPRRLSGWDFASRAGCVLWAALFFAVGCRESKPTVPTATLTGLVTIDGQPIPKGSIKFMPPSGSTAQPGSAEIVEGRYEATNVPLGQVRVMFYATKETGKMITEYSEPYPEVVNIIPKKHQSGMDLQVASDGGQQDFALTSK
jgi:hypothetical protein